MLSKFFATLAVSALALVGCASDETPDPANDETPGVSILQDGVIDDTDSVDTNIEVSENLGFGEPDEG